MSRRRRKRQRARKRQKRTTVPPKSVSAGKARTVQGGAPSAPGAPKNPQAQWVQVEYRDVDGNLTLPRNLIESTYPRRYEQAPPGTEIRVHVLAGYKPMPLMMVERKIYRIHRLSVRGWRRSGQIAVEVEEWRDYEADWFDAMQGVDLQISDPGLPGPHNEKSDYTIAETSFARKLVTQVDDKGGKTETRLHEGTLNIEETWRSAWRRQRTEVVNQGFKLLLLPLFAAFGAGLTLLLVNRPQSSDGDNLPDTQATSAQHEPSEGLSSDELSDIPSPQAQNDTLLESTDSPSKVVPPPGAGSGY